MLRQAVPKEGFHPPIQLGLAVWRLVGKTTDIIEVIEPKSKNTSWRIVLSPKLNTTNVLHVNSALTGKLTWSALLRSRCSLFGTGHARDGSDPN